MEKRMYFFVPCNISPIQQAIQAGHAALKYARKYAKDKEFQDFVDHWQTWIILNGGTTNDSYNSFNHDPCLQGIDGSIDYYNDFCKHDEMVKYTVFREPDLNMALTAICFVCDGRVFDYKTYPDLYDYILTIDFPDDTKEKSDSFMIRGKNYTELKSLFPEVYTSWARDVMGSDMNVFLRGLLKGKKLA